MKKYLFFLRLFAVFLTAGTQCLLSAPFSWWPLHWFSWVPFFWAIHVGNRKRNFLLGLLGGIFSNTLIFYWLMPTIVVFGRVSWPLAITFHLLLAALLSATWIGLAVLVPKVSKAYPRSWFYIAPALLVLFEFFFPQLFPYMQGVSHYQVLPIVQLASLTGVYGLSFLLLWSNALIYQCFWGTNRKNIQLHVVLFIFATCCVLVYGNQRLEEYQLLKKGAKVLKVGLVQSNLASHSHLSMRFMTVQRLYRRLSKEAAEKGAHWILWSEGEFTLPFQLKAAKRILREHSKKIKRPILFGALDFQDLKTKKGMMNIATHVTPDGNFGKMYMKRVLVPFGEYLPFEKFLKPLYRGIGLGSRFQAGTKTNISTLSSQRYGFLICYEAILPRLSRESVKSGARILVNLTYDGWFGKTTAPHQHLMLSTIRSAEHGVPLIRLATTGVSTIVEANGAMKKGSPLQKRGVFIFDVPLVYQPSLYTKVGDLFAWVCSILSLLILGSIFLQHRKEKTS